MKNWADIMLGGLLLVPGLLLLIYNIWIGISIGQSETWLRDFMISLISMGLGVMLLLRYKTHSQIYFLANQSQSWCQVPIWENNRIRSEASVDSLDETFYYLLLFFIFFLVYFFLEASLHQGKTLYAYPQVEEFNLFGLVEILLIVTTIILFWIRDVFKQREWEQFGELYLNIDPFPATFGQSLRCWLKIGIPYQPSHRYYASLSCLRYSQSAKKTVIWKQEIEGQAQAIADDLTQVEIHFNIPVFPQHEKLPESSIIAALDEVAAARENDYFQWKINIYSKSLSVNFNRTFKVPVFQPDSVRSRIDTTNTEARHAQQIPLHVRQNPEYRHWVVKEIVQMSQENPQLSAKMIFTMVEQKAQQRFFLSGEKHS